MVEVTFNGDNSNFYQKCPFCNTMNRFYFDKETKCKNCNRWLL